ncbi:hypothetical protein ACR9GP_08110 [Enterobacter ludwigii]
MRDPMGPDFGGPEGGSSDPLNRAPSGARKIADMAEGNKRRHEEQIKYHHKEDEDMNNPIVVSAPAAPYGGDLGFGGGLGGLLIGALLGRGGLGFGGGWGVSPGAAGVENPLLNTAVLSKMGSIEGMIPLSASQTQSAVAESTADIVSTTLQQTIALQGNQAALALATQSAIAGVKDSVQALAIGVVNDGDKTRALISQINLDNLNRQLAVAQNEITELRSERAADSRSHGLEINMINNQNQNQLQFQQQAQGMAYLQHGLAECNQIARATNQTIQVGNAGIATAGPQTANPTNVTA